MDLSELIQLILFHNSLFRDGTLDFRKLYDVLLNFISRCNVGGGEWEDQTG